MKNKPHQTVAILTVSDRCFRGQALDKSGPRLGRFVSRRGWRVVKAALVPDEKAKIKSRLIAWSGDGNTSLILTTGGTGLSPRDVTPQATREVLEKEVPGLAELMRREGLKLTPFSVLSQAVVGIRKKTLIVNLPGNPIGAEDSVRIIWKLISHALHVLSGGNHSKKETPHA